MLVVLIRTLVKYPQQYNNSQPSVDHDGVVYDVRYKNNELYCKLFFKYEYYLFWGINRSQIELIQKTELW